MIAAEILTPKSVGCAGLQELSPVMTTRHRTVAGAIIINVYGAMKNFMHGLTGKQSLQYQFLVSRIKMYPHAVAIVDHHTSFRSGPQYSMKLAQQRFRITAVMKHA